MLFETIITFWFDTHGPEDWYKKDESFDQEIVEKFSEAHEKAAAGELAAWRETPEGRLAEIILLDQFSRNMFRDSPESFAYDDFALSLAQDAIATGDDKKLPPLKRSFIYMPYMHSESLEVHEEAVRLFTDLGNEQNLKYEYLHKEIIDKYGRYPHRNKILGRESTEEEIEFLKTEGSSF